jgi:RNA polymerase sigma factor (sigma-70 family)
MLMNLDSELLCRYADAHCEDAFAELVRRHVNLVYSAALRQVNGDAHLAQDVAQNVFTDLARKAATLSRRPALTGWLYTSTHFAAAKAVRSESRRRAHEQEAHAMQELLQDPAQGPDWEKLGPVLDKVMHELNDSDREMVLMRYFENRRLGEIGERLGLSEDAARKRVDRALEKLRTFLFKRGITATASLAAVISANAVQTAPAGLAATLSSGALAGTALAAATTATLTKTIAMTVIQKTLIAATIAALAGTGFYEARQASRLRDQAQALQQQQTLLTEQLDQATSANKSLSSQLAQAGRPPSVSSERLRELLRLRGQVGVLRRQQHELEQSLAAAQSKGPQTAAHPAGAPSQPSVPAPFQVQLVADEPGQDTEPMTNSASGAKGDTLHVNKTPLLDYTAIRSVNVTKNAESGEPEIHADLSDEGRELFAAVTKENLNKRLAIVMNGQLYRAPVIRSEIADGKVLITGNFTEEEAQQLVAKINEAIRYQERGGSP